MNWKNQFSRTSYLVLFIILGAIGVGTASALVTITLSGNVLVTGDLGVDGEISGPTVSEIENQIGTLNQTASAIDPSYLSCSSQNLILDTFPDFPISDKCNVSFQPNGIKNSACLWSSDSINGTEFIKQNQIFLSTGELSLPASTNPDVYNPTQSIPDWIKINAGWYCVDVINYDAYEQGLIFLYQTGFFLVD